MTPAACYGLRQFRVAYGVQPLLDRGIDGRGQTVVLPELVPPVGSAAPIADIRTNLAQYDAAFRLPAVRLGIVNSLAQAASPDLADGEEIGDAEIVHAIAPEANIEVVLIPRTSLLVTDYAQAFLLAPSLGSVVALTIGFGEDCFTAADLASLEAAIQDDRQHHVTVIASSGDNGAAIVPCPSTPETAAPVKGVNFPASDPLVLAVGGTSLQANPVTGAYLGESVWNTPLPPGSPIPPPGLFPGGEPPVASNGGFSTLFARPAYQDGVGAIGATRGVPDVAADAAPNTGLALLADLNADPNGGYAIVPTAGTSTGAPFWAGIMALADQAAGRRLGFVNPAIYRIARGPLRTKAFHDVVTGDNSVTYPQGTVTGYPAAPGWDPATGWGSPDAAVLVPLLALDAGS
jgi:subtilase family serine protease